jgi:hypothetical protein
LAYNGIGDNEAIAIAKGARSRLLSASVRAALPLHAPRPPRFASLSNICIALALALALAKAINGVVRNEQG